MATSTATRCRRRSDRRPLPEGSAGVVEFGYPTPKGHVCSMKLRDISLSGLSFVLGHELPGIEVGCTLVRLTVSIGRRKIRGDLVVMHLTPDESAGSVCGGLFHPIRDSDIVKLKSVIAELDHEHARPS